MERNSPPYNRYSLVREMYEAVDYIKNTNPSTIKEFGSGFPAGMPFMLTGEGSSRILPGRNAAHNRLKHGTGPLVLTESSTDLSGKNLDEFIIIGASNSGRTRELVNLFRDLIRSGHRHLYGLTCNRDSLLEEISAMTFIIEAGPEQAVAASKSVVAQALFYDILLSDHYTNRTDTGQLAEAFEATLDIRPEKNITELICRAETVYFAGLNNGVAEELALKANEIIRKKSAFLPGTLLLHGVEEVMSSGDIIIMVDDYRDEYEKIRSIYTGTVGTPVITISAETSPFHTFTIPPVTPEQDPYIRLAAGWNMLIEAGISLKIDIDKPERARKIGNEAEE